MKRLVPFRDADERDEWQWRANALSKAARDLPALTRDPELVRYRLTGSGSGGPMLPSVADLARAEEVLQQAAECLRDYHRQRVRYDDDPDPWRDGDGLDDEVPF